MALGPLALLVFLALLIGAVFLIVALGRRRKSRSPNPAEQERIEKMLRE